MTLMCVCLRGIIHVFKKRNDITVWLQIVKKIKSMGPTNLYAAGPRSSESSKILFFASSTCG